MHTLGAAARVGLGRWSLAPDHTGLEVGLVTLNLADFLGRVFWEKPVQKNQGSDGVKTGFHCAAWQ